MLTEYLFRDDHRLNEYAGQINPSLTVVEKSRQWTAGLSLMGPKAEATQGERTRPTTQDEKAKLTLDYLRTNAGVHEGRPGGPYEMERGPLLAEPVTFVYERCHASRVVVPSNISTDMESAALVLWVSRSTHRDGVLPPGGCRRRGSAGVERGRAPVRLYAPALAAVPRASKACRKRTR